MDLKFYRSEHCYICNNKAEINYRSLLSTAEYEVHESYCKKCGNKMGRELVSDGSEDYFIDNDNCQVIGDCGKLLLLTTGIGGKACLNEVSGENLERLLDYVKNNKPLDNFVNSEEMVKRSKLWRKMQEEHKRLFNPKTQHSTYKMSKEMAKGVGYDYIGESKDLINGQNRDFYVERQYNVIILRVVGETYRTSVDIQKEYLDEFIEFINSIHDCNADY